MLKNFKKSIKNKLLILLLSATIIPILTSTILTYRYTTESLKNSAINENIRLLTGGKKNIIFYFDLVNKASLSVYNVGRYNNTLINIFKKNINNYKFDDPIYKSLYFINDLLDYVYQINLYISHTKQSYLFRNFLLAKNFNTDNTFRTKINTSDTFIESTHKTINYGVNHIIHNKNINVLSFHRKIYDVPKGNLLGYISIDIDLKSIENIINDLYKSEYEQIYIINKNDNKIIYSSKKSEIGKLTNKPWYNKLLKTSNTQSFEIINNDFKGIIIFENIKTNYMNWVIVKKIPYNYLYMDAKHIANSNIIAGIILVIIITILTLYVSIHFTNPIKELINYTKKVKEGNLKVDIKVTRDDEFGVLTNHFKHMLNSINNLIIKEYKLEIANKANELKALQNQINPHFINNTLQSIGTEALKQGSTNVYLLISKLGNMMHYSMHTNNVMVNLNDEIKYCITYLELQKQRFKENFEFTFDIQEETKSIKIPKMTLQPIIENYFKHSFENSNNTGKIIIRSKLDKENCLIIEVENNGIGIEYDKLPNIINNIKNTDTSSKKIGLNNVYSRLKFYYNSNVDLLLENIKPKGFKVTIKIWR